MDEVVLLMSNFATLDEARRVCRVLVEERLAACANMLPGVESIYCWQGAVEVAQETTALLKTTREGYGQLERRLCELHSYEVPEIIALPIEFGSEPYLRWVRENTGG